MEYSPERSPHLLAANEPVSHAGGSLSAVAWTLSHLLIQPLSSAICQSLISLTSPFLVARTSLIASMFIRNRKANSKQSQNKRQNCQVHMYSTHVVPR